MTCEFMSFSTVFQSNQDDEMSIMKGCVQWNMSYKGLSFGSKDYNKELKTVECVQVFWTRLACFGQLGLISDHQISSKL